MTHEIKCGQHGTTRATFVCQHMFDDWCAGRAPEMVCQVPCEDDPFPDTWCELCEAEFQATRETLVDGFWPSAGLVALCTVCYAEIRASAEEGGKLRIV